MEVCDGQVPRGTKRRAPFSRTRRRDVSCYSRPGTSPSGQRSPTAEERAPWLRGRHCSGEARLGALGPASAARAADDLDVGIAEVQSRPGRPS